jgi:hypothetical protein
LSLFWSSFKRFEFVNLPSISQICSGTSHRQRISNWKWTTSCEKIVCALWERTRSLRQNRAGLRRLDIATDTYLKTTTKKAINSDKNFKSAKVTLNYYEIEALKMKKKTLKKVKLPKLRNKQKPRNQQRIVRYEETRRTSIC